MTTTPDPSTSWVKSSYSNGQSNGCVEWAPTVAATTHTIPVRDSKNPTGPSLTFPAAAWETFVGTFR